MAKTKRELIIATFIISCATTILLVVSLATEEWVRGDIKPNVLGLDKAEINYGLFGGKLVQYYLGTNKRESNIAIACLFEDNICGYSAATQGDDRTTELKSILNQISCKNDASSAKSLQFSNTFTTKTPNIYSIASNETEENIEHVYHYKEPKRTKKENEIERHEFDDVSFEIELLNTDTIDSMRYTKVKRDLNQLTKDDTKATDSPITTTTKEPDINDLMPKCDPTFLNGGLWLMTTFFLSLSIILSALTATLSVMNTAGNPISPWLNIWGLYIWNGLSSAFIFLTLVLWGAEFGAFVSSNVGVTVTLSGIYRNDSVGLGFSFWMLLTPFCLHIGNIGLFYFRQHLIDKEPEINEEKIEAAGRDGMIFVY